MFATRIFLSLDQILYVCCFNTGHDVFYIWVALFDD